MAGLPVVAAPPPAPAPAPVAAPGADAMETEEGGARDSRGKAVLDSQEPRSISDIFGKRSGKKEGAGEEEGDGDEDEEQGAARHAKARKAEAAADVYTKGNDAADPEKFMDQVGWKGDPDATEAGGFKAFDYGKAASEAEAAAVPHVAQFDPHGTIGTDVKHKE
ncbi:hypothetical protein T484DRAFT_1741829, partial [Baffinella frigidus]